MAKTKSVFIRIEPEVKEQAEFILEQLGIPMSNAVNMFLKQVVLQKGIPFELKIPSSRLLNVLDLSESELDAELEKGYSDYLNNNTFDAGSVFLEIQKDYKLWDMK